MILFIGLLLALLLAWAISTYNRLIRLRNQVLTAWSDIDVQLARRHDLVPQLVSAVRAFAAHETAALQAVTALRQRALATHTRPELAQAEEELQRAIDHLLALEESYPELKASGNFLQLQRDLVQVEEQLQYARRFYNGAVRDHNDAVERFPARLLAGALGFAAESFFSANPARRIAPDVAQP